MVLNRPFQCPTQVHSGTPYGRVLGELLSGKKWGLVTSAGWIKRGILKKLEPEVGTPTVVIDSVPENPKIQDILTLADGVPPVDSIVALGGGSVIDGAKGIAALLALGGGTDLFLSHLTKAAPLPDEAFAPPPLIAVPTTSGTGSEVTRWATIWGEDKKKYSLHHPSLYPNHAILDPALCVSMPASVTLSSGLDALSHAMEAVWNVNHTPLSDKLATVAISMLRASLPQVLSEPATLEARGEVQLATCLAGLAMGTTQTALAHSISYPFTAEFGLPHGFACSFTLGAVARFNLEKDAPRLTPITEGMGCTLHNLPETIDTWLEECGIGSHISTYCSPEDANKLAGDLITPARAANNLRLADNDAALKIVRQSLERFISE